MYNILFIYLSFNGPLGGFHFLDTVNSGSITFSYELSFKLVFDSFGCIPRGEVAGLVNNPRSDLLRKCQTVPCQLHYLTFLLIVSEDSHLPTLATFFLVLAMLEDVKWF